MSTKENKIYTRHHMLKGWSQDLIKDSSVLMIGVGALGCEIAKDFGRIEWTQPYAKYHQSGGGKLPKRVIAELDPQTNSEITRALQKKINRDIGIFGR